jgi:hypothetical protein
MFFIKVSFCILLMVFCCLYNLYSTQKNLQPTFLEKKCPPKPQVRNYIENKNFMRPYIFLVSLRGGGRTLFTFQLSSLRIALRWQIRRFSCLVNVGVHGSSIYIFDLIQVAPYSPFERDVAMTLSRSHPGAALFKRPSQAFRKYDEAFTSLASCDRPHSPSGLDVLCR